jgi:hypothetical protein
VIFAARSLAGQVMKSATAAHAKRLRSRTQQRSAMSRRQYVTSQIAQKRNQYLQSRKHHLGKWSVTSKAVARLRRAAESNRPGLVLGAIPRWRFAISRYVAGESSRTSSRSQQKRREIPLIFSIDHPPRFELVIRRNWQRSLKRSLNGSLQPRIAMLFMHIAAFRGGAKWGIA